MTPWTHWITNIHDTDTRQTGSKWFWITIMPTMTVYPDIPWNQRNVSDAKWNDDQFVQVAVRRTALLSKIAIHDTLAKIDPTFNRARGAGAPKVQGFPGTPLDLTAVVAPLPTIRLVWYGPVDLVAL